MGFVGDISEDRVKDNAQGLWIRKMTLLFTSAHNLSESNRWPSVQINATKIQRGKWKSIKSLVHHGAQNISKTECPLGNIHAGAWQEL